LPGEAKPVPPKSDLTTDIVPARRKDNCVHDDCCDPRTYELRFLSPLGPVKIRGGISMIWQVDFCATEIVKVDVPVPDMLLACRSQLDEYFKRKRRVFELELDPRGTAFQKRVWSHLLRIPYGETRSYKEIAGDVGNRQATRAVGAANASNPISIIIPCHRVIGTKGDLVGYGGGLWRKRWLLDHERDQVSDVTSAERRTRTS
jgi:methylated-DNA-[protein]-cysteine S-methyltransferase